MIESSNNLQEETHLILAEQDAKLKRAEFLAKKVTKMFGSLRAGSEHYGIKYGEVLRESECAYRLAYESTDFNAPSQGPNKTRAESVIREIEMFCQMNRWIITKEKVELPGLLTVNVKIDSKASSEI